MLRTFCQPISSPKCTGSGKHAAQCYGRKGFQELEKEEQRRKERTGLEGRREAGRRAGEEEEGAAAAPRCLRSGTWFGGDLSVALGPPSLESLALGRPVNPTLTVPFNILSLS